MDFALRPQYAAMAIFAAPAGMSAGTVDGGVIAVEIRLLTAAVAVAIYSTQLCAEKTRILRLRGASTTFAVVSGGPPSRGASGAHGRVQSESVIELLGADALMDLR